ncbi:MAG: four helix bundle protein [Bacteroidetes bacterium RIFCSPLOWO2_12_FULL_35_15]|nr:MAG: four helix bundle protein [Bacteroidetes bacterium RIFCSPLOWO2_12_FULL_35_15]
MYKDFTEMPVWQLAMEVAEQVFSITNDLPKKEDYGLTSQIRRSSVSVSANIAEAFGRSTAPDKNKFYDYSRGSAFETKSLLIYGNKVGYFETESSQNINEKLNVIIYNLNKVKLALSNKTKSLPQT